MDMGTGSVECDCHILNPRSAVGFVTGSTAMADLRATWPEPAAPMRKLWRLRRLLPEEAEPAAIPAAPAAVP
eukprot:6318291-Heterocapsa_arctica.AAC.1